MILLYLDLVLVGKISSLGARILGLITTKKLP